MKLKLLLKGLLMGVLVFAVAGCQKVVYRDREPEPAPTPPPPPGIEGTWEFVDSYQEEDGTTINESGLVTFTKERYVEAFESRDSDGMLVDRWTLRGTWQESGGTITKTYDEHGHDGVRLMGSVEKAYFWGDNAHDTLWVQEWRDRSRSRGQVFTRLTRVKQALPTTSEAITGTWRFLHRSGTEWKLTITPEGAFEMAWARDHPENPNWLRGQVVSIDVQNLYVYLSGLTRYVAGDDVTRRFLSHLSDTADGTGRIAFAPAHGGDIIVSNPWNEPPNIAIMHEYADWEDQPYGSYWMRFSKVQ